MSTSHVPNMLMIIAAGFAVTLMAAAAVAFVVLYARRARSRRLQDGDVE